MARGRLLKIKTREFPTKGKATEFFKKILHSYDIGGKVSEDDASELMALIEHHKDYKDKVGVGISHFEIMSADYGTRCFRIIRIDGSKDRFSYKHCIEN